MRALFVLRASVLVWALLALGCGDRGDIASRKTYNDGLAKLQAGSLEDAAKAFLDARQNAGNDPELRAQAAYNLGLTYARQADAAEEPQAGIELLRQSAAWFRDAVQLRPNDTEARVNLEVVLRRIQVLVDQLNKGQNSLEARLDRVIEDQRTLLDQIRSLMDQVGESGATAEPVAFQEAFDDLATQERTLLADVGTISDLAGEELGLLESKASQASQAGQGAPDSQAQLSQEEQVRMVQLKNLEHYLQEARTNMADTRRLLRRLQGDKAHRRSDTALAALKRAREQLLDPVTVLKGIAQDHTTLIMHTGGLAELRNRKVNIADAAGEQAPPIPAWLTTEHLSERQDGIRARVNEVTERFRAATAHADSTAAADPGTSPDLATPGSGDDSAAQGGPPAAASPEDRAEKRALESAKAALPHLETALTAMTESAAALTAGTLPEAVAKQNQALIELLAAIERFSDIRTLIELLYAEHGGVLTLLTPPGQGDKTTEAMRQNLPELSAADRAARIAEAVTKNLDRLGRLEVLFADELTALDEQAKQAAQGQDPAQAQPGAPPQGAPNPEQIEAAKQQYQRAQTLRQQALDAMTRLSALAARAGAGQGSGGEALAAAREAMTHVEELRRIFFSIIEHLKELLRNQTETHDGTASAAGAADAELANLLGPLVGAQQAHAGMGEPLATALAEQADQAGQSDQPQAQESAKRFAQAAEEVRQATMQMNEAGRLLSEGLEALQMMSPDLSPSLEAQTKAMTHLENAIRLLEPPQQQDQKQQEQQDQQDQDQQDQQQQQQQQDQDQQDLSQQQAQNRLQEVRDREAERMREKNKREQAPPEPVEKDW